MWFMKIGKTRMTTTILPAATTVPATGSTTMLCDVTHFMMQFQFSSVFNPELNSIKSQRRRMHLCKVCVLTLCIFLQFLSVCVNETFTPHGAHWVCLYVINCTPMHLDGTQSIFFGLYVCVLLLLLLLLLSSCNDLTSVEIANFLSVFFKSKHVQRYTQTCIVYNIIDFFSKFYCLIISNCIDFSWIRFVENSFISWHLKILRKKFFRLHPLFIEEWVFSFYDSSRIGIFKWVLLLWYFPGK